ncbi:18251_t:CDS:2, partial [Acaulospora morrowiae]
PMKIKEGSMRAVWSEDAWLQKYALKSADPLVPFESDEEGGETNQREEMDTSVDQ